MKKLIYIVLFLAFCGCSSREKLMVVTFTKSRVSTQMTMPYDREFKRSLKDSAHIDVKIIRRKHQAE